MNFQDIATRILDVFSKKLVKEAVSTLPEEQQVMVDYYGSNLPLKLANYEGEKWYKFWMMNDGTIIPVKFAHVNTSSEAFEGNGYYFDPYSSLIESGAIRGHIDPSNNEISIEFNDLPTSGQIDSLKKLIIKYSVKKIVTDDYGTMELKSPEHLEYLITYGPVEEKKLDEDGAPAGPAPAVQPTGTTEDHISYLPTRLGEKGKKLRKKKRKLVKEAVATSTLPGIQQKLVNKLGVIRYESEGVDEKRIVEAVSVDLKRLRSDLKKELIKLFNDEAFLLMVNHYDVWRSTFGVKSHRTAKVAVTIENSERDIQRLYGQLLREYGDSKGNLEMLIAAIQDRRPLGQFDVFNKFNNLFGTRVESVFGGVTLVFEGTIDFIYDSSESVYIEDDEVLDSVEEMFGRIIKRSRKLIYPVGGKFRVGFFNGLKNLIASGDDKMENTDEEV